MAKLPNLNSKFLHLGCGLDAPEEWLNVDGSLQASFARWPLLKRILVGARLYPKSQAEIRWPTNVLRVDLRRRLPFPPAHFEAIYSSHTFEHLFRSEAEALARECLRVMKPGGICRIVVPDLAAAVTRFWDRRKNEQSAGTAADELLDELMLQPRSPAGGALALYHRLMNMHQHKWMYDGASLAGLLSRVGFVQAKIYTSREGELPKLLEIEKPSRIEGGAGVAVEATKV